MSRLLQTLKKKFFEGLHRMMGHDKYTRMHGYVQIILSSCFFLFFSSCSDFNRSASWITTLSLFSFFCSEEISLYTHGAHSTVLVQGERRLPTCKRPVRDQMSIFHRIKTGYESGPTDRFLTGIWQSVASSFV